MKKLIFVFCFAFANFLLHSQEAFISQVLAKPGDIVNISVTAKDFKYVAAIGIYIKFDPGVLKYINASDFYLPFYNEIIDTSHTLIANHNDSVFMLAWFDSNEKNVAIENEIKIFDLKFLYKGGNSIILFDTSKTIFYKEKFGKSGLVKISVDYHNGSVMQTDTVGISESAYNKIKIFPNPVQDYIIIDLNSSVAGNNIRLFNSIGLCVFNSNDAYSSVYKVNMSYLPKGIYFLRVENSDGVFIKKLIKN